MSQGPSMKQLVHSHEKRIHRRTIHMSVKVKDLTRMVKHLGLGTMGIVFIGLKGEEDRSAPSVAPSESYSPGRGATGKGMSYG